jgi:UDP-N-acetylglucosamine 2-epimerase
MSELFEIKNKMNSIIVSCHRFENFNDVKTLVNEISNACNRYNSFKILIHNYSAQHLSPLHCVLIVEYFQNAGITQHHMIALVNPMKDHIDDKDKFLVTVAMNRGWDNIKIFAELDDAKQWLGSYS